MAAAFNFNNLVLKMLADNKFRAAVEKNPAQALRSVGAKATKAQVASLKAVNWASLEKVQDAFRAGVHPDSLS